MTPDHDFERVLDRWFTEGPARMPDRFLADTLDRIDRHPQPRLARLQTKLLVLHPDLRFAAVAMVVLAVAGVGASLLTRTGGVGNAPAVGSGLLPTSGQTEWRPVGTRVHPTPSGVDRPTDLDIVFDPTTLTIFEWHGDVHSSASVVGADRLELRMLDDPVVQWPVAGGTRPTPVWPCQVGDAGTYRFSLSSGGRHLTLVPESDACAARATILAGDWVLTDIGDLAPGRHVSSLFKPLGGGTSGQFSFTVPSGWAVGGDQRSETSIWLERAQAANSPDGRPVPTIGLFSSVVPNPQAASCADTGAIPAERTSLAYARWLMSIQDLVVTTPIAVTIGGLSGVMVDLSVRPGWTNGCDGSGVHTFSEFVQPEGQDSALTVAGEKRARYRLLDVGQGIVLLIDVEAPDQPTWEAAIADTTQIVESFEFAR